MGVGKKIYVCVGSGGVGKTTISACLALKAAISGHRVLVLTIDPARRLANALGIDGLTDNQDHQVKLPEGSGEMFASMINPQLVFDQFVKTAANDASIAVRLLNNSLYKQLSTTLNGSQEFTSLERLLQSYENSKYDVIILDTPPSQHALDFLAAPKKISSLFNKSVTKWFVSDSESSGLFSNIFNKGTKTALKALEKATGSGFIGELSDFFANIAMIQDKVGTRSEAAYSLMKSENTHFILVTGFDESKLKEANDFVFELRKLKYQVSAIIVNRCFPVWSTEERKWSEEMLNDELLLRLKGFHSDLRKFYLRREKIYDEFISRNEGKTEVHRVPDLMGEIDAIDGLLKLSEYVPNIVKAESDDRETSSAKEIEHEKSH